MSNNSSIRPENILPDGVDNASINGKIVRKGTIAAFLANAEILEKQNSTDIQKQEAVRTMKELAPAVVATGLHQYVVFKNKEIEQILIDAE
ncbi:hypothetical protein DGG96_01115 [Legionella qingyii]|uniref:Preprotein translocase subunit SecD n=1 Tax=Legionella qingyii TaxID=2184757 RepID=A0A317U9G6_9GAMM|nr:hypothetical protein [Legionella qingyii]PWY57030.1 hypothetical protein DGG96_03310 [Legionella qingyii]PWY57349.1 hypothetical protein DGG96_01115 [Legionella qingyii]RUR26438.1 hypothetical protein ELY20_00520 [Legionella qingyii]RUR27458.1 hypothetical protein ELY16_04865 [Legionella qingyii]